MNKHLKIILRKMCKEIGADFDKIDFKKPGWFMKYEWTEKQQNKYKEWLGTYLKNSKEARQELMHFPRKSNVKKFASEFVWNYGWKING